ncbi:phytoene/squalene synthase family protein [Ferruginivarius sediminum]|uniref:Squalene/phytoene synthase family protein n=1 Tax=Ferruginivarius sediminum TaxID=2661937 RepID=A0A369T7X8_9PROT|nr:phytoene/squalene synthase family protein [Ferruginivarius sediminum]RDD61431.1 squalene/phytoene synthase family protein [Ferruginivarius sediminum]
MAHDNDTELSYCAQQLRRYDHDRFLMCLFAPPPVREEMFALYAFNHEVAKVAEVVTEPMAGRIRIQWWREALDGLFGGQPRKHQVAEPLSQAIRAHGLPRKPFERLLDARENDLEDTPPKTLADLEGYAGDTSSTLVELALGILDVRDERSRSAAHHVGIAWALTGLARAVPFHASQRRLLLPGDLTYDAGLDPHDLFELRQPKEVATVVRQVAERAGEHLDQATNMRRDVPRHATPALLPAVLARRYLRVLEKHGHDPFQPRVQLPLPGRPLRLLWAATTGRY